MGRWVQDPELAGAGQLRGQQPLSDHEGRLLRTGRDGDQRGLARPGQFHPFPIIGPARAEAKSRAGSVQARYSCSVSRLVRIPESALAELLQAAGRPESVADYLASAELREAQRSGDA